MLNDALHIINIERGVKHHIEKRIVKFTNNKNQNKFLLQIY